MVRVEDRDEEQRLLEELRVVLGALIPGSDDGRMPSAAALGLEAAVWARLSLESALAEMVRDGLRALDAASHARYGCSFAEASSEARSALLAEQGFVLPLFLHALAAYYSQPAVLSALGLPPRPPHPQGYRIEDQD